MTKRKAQPHAVVSRQWIASSNAEWGCVVGDGGWWRGGTLARALSLAAEGMPEAGCTIVVLRDDTAEQAKRAHQAFFGGDR